MPGKRIGILGGMGPEATVIFFNQIVQLTPAETDQDHIPIIIYNYPQIPDRTKAIVNHEQSPVPFLKSGLSLLKKAGVDFVCIPCNTAHFYFDEIQKSTDLPILHIINCLVEYALKNIPDLSQVGLMATIGTIKTNLYQEAFQKQNIVVIEPDESELNKMQNIIQNIKSKSKDSRPAQEMAEGLLKKGCQALILGCTELSLVASDLHVRVPILDSSEILAKKAVQIALNQTNIF